jgi:Fic family protein
MATTGNVDGPVATKNTLHDLLVRIEGEYHEMPGMCVTPPQAQRLWGLDAATCEVVLATLLDRGIVKRTPRGTYVKC